MIDILIQKINLIIINMLIILSQFGFVDLKLLYYHMKYPRKYLRLSFTQFLRCTGL